MVQDRRNAALSTQRDFAAILELMEGYADLEGTTEKGIEAEAKKERTSSFMRRFAPWLGEQVSEKLKSRGVKDGLALLEGEVAVIARTMIKERIETLNGLKIRTEQQETELERLMEYFLVFSDMDGLMHIPPQVHESEDSYRLYFKEGGEKEGEEEMNWPEEQRNEENVEVLKDLIPGICTLLLSLYLLFAEKFWKEKTHEKKLLFQILLLNLTGGVLAAFLDSVPDILGWEKYLQADMQVDMAIQIVKDVTEVLFLLVTLLWLVFVDYSCYQSMAHIRRTYPLKLIPVALVISLTVIGQVIELWLYTSETGFFIAGAFLLAGLAGSLILQIVYAVKAYLILRKYDKKRKPPRALKLSGILLPILAGYLLRFLLGEDYRPLGVAAALFFTVLLLRRRDRYVDEETGFYNAGFLGEMNQYLEDHGFLDGSALFLRAPMQRRMEMAGILRVQKPEDAEVFFMGDGDFLITSGKQDEETMGLLSRNLNSAAGLLPNAFEIKTVETSRLEGESVQEYTDRLRYLGMSMA